MLITLKSFYEFQIYAALCNALRNIKWVLVGDSAGKTKWETLYHFIYVHGDTYQIFYIIYGV